jgi:hypothetical protein
MDTTELIQVLQRISDTQELKDIPGSTLAEIVHALADREVYVGGPYAILPKEENSLGNKASLVNLELNLAVRTFLYKLGITLPSMHVPENKALLVKNHRADTGFNSDFSENISFEDEKNIILAQIYSLAHKRFKEFPKPMYQKALEVITKTIERNKDSQIMLMPLFIRMALGEKGKEFSDDLISEIAFNGILFWAATIIYDDFWDEDDSANPELLPIANVFERQYIQYFTSLSPEFTIFFHGIMDKLDAANAWETRECRMDRDNSTIVIPDKLPEYGKYENKFYPAAGIIFGPVWMLLQLGHTLESTEVLALIAYFEHYIIGMQLNDDMHDWKEDLERGHISTAVEKLLSFWIAEHPDTYEINLGEDLPEFEKLFWFKVLSPLAIEGMAHSKMSYAALKDSLCIKNPEVLEEFIARNDRIARKAYCEYTQSMEFISGMPENSEIS